MLNLFQHLFFMRFRNKFGMTGQVRNDRMNISITKFVTLIASSFPQVFPAEEPDFLHYAHTRGWLEDQDERFCDKNLNRQTAARIMHQFMKIELGVPDLENISGANVLADLYTCHTCVNHIAQIFLRGIMEAQTVERDGVEYKIFNHLEEVSEEEAILILKHVSAISCSSNE